MSREVAPEALLTWENLLSAVAEATALLWLFEGVVAAPAKSGAATLMPNARATATTTNSRRMGPMSAALGKATPEGILNSLKSLDVGKALAIDAFVLTHHTDLGEPPGMLGHVMGDGHVTVTRTECSDGKASDVAIEFRELEHPLCEIGIVRMAWEGASLQILEGTGERGAVNRHAISPRT